MDKKDLTKLVDKYLKMNEAYYNGDTIASDKEFDTLKKTINSYRDIKEFKTIISRIDIVGATPKLSVLKHIHRMYSLDNIFSIEELEDWIAKHPNDTKYSLELKYDGASLDVSYLNGGISKAISRGDGIKGVDVTDNVFSCLPRKVGEGNINIHGEVIITFKEFELANARRIKDNLKPYLSPRNAASSEMMHGNGYARLSFAPYTLFKDQQRGYTDEIKRLFPKSSIPYSKILDKKDLIKEAKRLYVNKNTNIPIDGLVIKVANKELAETLGYTSKFPKFAIALKFPETDSTTTLLDVVWQVGHTGTLTPVGILEPVEMHDCTVSRVTLNNMQFVILLTLGYNDKVMIIRSGGVIPKLTGVLSKFGTFKLITIPDKCPSCNKNTSILGPNLICTNLKCPDRVKAKLTRFVSRDYADVKGVSKELIDKLYNKGVRTLVDLVSIDASLLETIPSLKEKSINNILSAMKDIHNLPMDKFLASLGIDGLGRTTGKAIAYEIDKVEDILNLNLNTIDGIGSITSVNILAGLAIDFNIIVELERILKPTKVKRHAHDTPTVCFTGKFNIPRKTLERISVERGYKVVSSVTKNLTMLMVGYKPSSKLAKAKKLGVTIVDISEIQEYDPDNSDDPIHILYNSISRNNYS